MNLVSVVIPSLGKRHLLETIQILNTGTKVPSEILICMPIGTSLEFDIPENSKVIFCSEQSQVAQRLIGFQSSKSEFVLQLDDDTHLAPNCLEILVEHSISNKINSAIAPSIFNSETKKSIYKDDNRATRFNMVKNYICNGYELHLPGTVSSAGVSLGPKFSNVNISMVKVEWLAGCCILHRRCNLISNNYYPFKGKAYCEDLIASYYYTLKNITLYSSNKSVCYTVPSNPKYNSLIGLIHDLRARRFYVILSKKSSNRFYIYAVFRVCYEILVNIPKRIFL
jgi:hypothetical protein